MQSVSSIYCQQHLGNLEAWKLCCRTGKASWANSYTALRKAFTSCHVGNVQSMLSEVIDWFTAKGAEQCLMSICLIETIGRELSWYGFVSCLINVLCAHKLTTTWRVLEKSSCSQGCSTACFFYFASACSQGLGLEQGAACQPSDPH